jgi:hypothetical protein
MLLKVNIMQKQVMQLKASIKQKQVLKETWRACLCCPGDYPDARVDERGYIHRKYIVASRKCRQGMTENFALKYLVPVLFITGFHGPRILRGVILVDDPIMSSVVSI